MTIIALEKAVELWCQMELRFQELRDLIAPSLDRLRIHDLRHSFASFAVMDGAALYLVGKVLGHRQSRTTEIYAHVADDPLHATAELAAQRIALAISGARSQASQSSAD